MATACVGNAELARVFARALNALPSTPTELTLAECATSVAEHLLAEHI